MAFGRSMDGDVKARMYIFGMPMHGFSPTAAMVAPRVPSITSRNGGGMMMAAGLPPSIT